MNQLTPCDWAWHTALLKNFCTYVVRAEDELLRLAMTELEQIVSESGRQNLAA